jgi:hypothetical protein
MSLFSEPVASEFHRQDKSRKHSKIERYGWKLLNEPGKFEMLDKNILRFDVGYQRHLNINKARMMAASWSWMACGAISVGRRDGNNYTFDGQHRVHAARLRVDIKLLPCIVFKTTAMNEEAQGFLDANTGRRPVNAVEKFRAQVSVGHPDAVMVHGLVSSASYVVSMGTHDGAVRCVRTLLEWAHSDPQMLTEMWPLVLELSARGPIQQRIVDPLCYLESRLRNTGDHDTEQRSILKAPWRERVLRLGVRGIIDSGKTAAAYYAKGGAKVWSKGLLKALNKGARHRLFVSKDLDE